MKPVSETAMVRRINRRLWREDRSTLCVTRFDSRSFDELGRYYIANARNIVEAKHVDLAELANELRCLKPGEVLQ